MAMTIVGTPGKTKDKFTYSNGLTTYVAEYLLQFTGAYSAAALAALVGTSTLPAAGSAHPVDSNAFVSNIEGDMESDAITTGTTTLPGAATLLYTWTRNVFEVTPVSILSRPAVIQWRGTGRTESAQTDINGDPLVNSAGQLYDPLPDRPCQGGEVSITYNVASNPWSMCVNNSGTVNSDAWYGVAAGNALIGIIEASQQSEQFGGTTVNYWQVTVPIAFNNNGWKSMLIDNGYKIVNDDGDLEVHRDKLGTATPVPILLDGAGAELEQGGTPVVYPDDGYKIIYESAFTGLSLPNPFA